jgi:hypothetical protein
LPQETPNLICGSKEIPRDRADSLQLETALGAAYEHRKLSAKVHCDLRRQSVTQRVQHGPRGIESVIAIAEVKLLGAALSQTSVP